jgi:hypothetical protein
VDPKRFDAVSQRLAAIGDRRRVLGALGALGGLAVIGLPAAEVDAARAARCIKVDRPCSKSKRGPHPLCRTHCCAKCGGTKRCKCCPDGVVPKRGVATDCCSGYINTTDGTCQSTCAPTCAKCCPPPTGSTTPHCGTAQETCCSSALGGGACTTGNQCCNNTADCPIQQACISGCCLPIN